MPGDLLLLFMLMNEAGKKKSRSSICVDGIFHWRTSLWAHQEARWPFHKKISKSQFSFPGRCLQIGGKHSMNLLSLNQITGISFTTWPWPRFCLLYLNLETLTFLGYAMTVHSLLIQPCLFGFAPSETWCLQVQKLSGVHGTNWLTCVSSLPLPALMF